MSDNAFSPGPTPRTVRAANGEVLTVPDHWSLLPPGDAGLTRRVTAAGDHRVVQEKRGRKTFSRGVWPPADTIERIRTELDNERSTAGFAKRQEANARRRAKVQDEYVQEFVSSVVAFLDFPPVYAALSQQLAMVIASHATPVGSGTVARTKRIPVEQRTEAAVVAWMRHQTTAYDSMKIPGIRGKRREVRKLLAERSRDLLRLYRRGESVPADCPLQQALHRTRLSTLIGTTNGQ